MFLLFGRLFIFACGTTHVIGRWTLWHGTYRLEGVIKAVTAAAPVGTAVLLVQLPQALPSPSQVRAANEELEREIAHRRRVEHALVEAHEYLETTVQRRTPELARAKRN